MLLKSNQSEYLPIIESAGARIAIHSQDQEPFVDAFGYNAATGFTTSFGIQYVSSPNKLMALSICIFVCLLLGVYYKTWKSLWQLYRKYRRLPIQLWGEIYYRGAEILIVPFNVSI